MSNPLARGARLRSEWWRRTWTSFLVLSWLPPVWADQVQKPAFATTTKAPTSLLVEAVSYHRTWDRESPLDWCSFYRLMEAPVDFPRRLPTWMQEMPGVGGEVPCTAIAASGDSLGLVRPVRTFILDSISIRGAEATLFSTMIRGENLHREDYRMRLLDGPGGRWVVGEVRIWGAMRIYP